MTSERSVGAAMLGTAMAMTWFAPVLAEPTRAPAQTSEVYKLMARQEAEKAGLPPDLADAVMAIESSYDPTRIGNVGEIGLMQVRPGTAALMGFRGTARELADPATNIHFGVIYLAGAWHRANGDLCRALMKYRAGHGEEAMSPLSVSYCGRARAHLASRGSDLAGVGAGTDFHAMERKTAAVGTPPRRLRGAAFWAARKVFVLRQNAQIERRWRERARQNERIRTASEDL